MLQLCLVCERVESKNFILLKPVPMNSAGKDTLSGGSPSWQVRQKSVRVPVQGSVPPESGSIKLTTPLPCLLLSWHNRQSLSSIVPEMCLETISNSPPEPSICRRPYTPSRGWQWAHDSSLTPKLALPISPTWQFAQSCNFTW